MRHPCLLVLTLLLACDPTGIEDAEPVELTLRLKLAGGRNVGASPARVFVYSDSAPVPRAFALPENGEPCTLTATPVTVCTMSVPRYGHVSLIVSEPEPAVFVRLAPQSVQDTVRDGRFVEFTDWTECANRTDRGVCVIRPSGNATVEANFQLMQQVSVYQIGVASMDYVALAEFPTLRVPPVNDNILDYAGCRRVLNPPAAPCDSVRMVGEAPYHRFTAFVPRKTIVGMFPMGGVDTDFQGWVGDCIPSGIYGGGVCSLISPDTSGAPIMLTARYSWWQCPGGPSDQDRGGCALRGVDALTSVKRNEGQTPASR
jgi:hypothetical protein